MKSQGDGTSQTQSHLGVALDEEIGRLELRIAEVWVVLSGVGALAAVAVGIEQRSTLAIAGSIAALVYLGWFAVSAWMLRRGRAGQAMRVASTIVESALPWAFLMVLHFTAGPTYALGSWVPPMLFAALIVGSTARLRTLEPLLIGIAGGVAFPLLYLLLLRGALPVSASDESLYAVSTQIVRGVSLVFGGALAMLVARTLRRAIAKAESIAREQDLFGKYRLGKHIASGGMGTVYTAVYCPEGGFERPVAIKRVHPHLAGEERFVVAFRREAELCARLVHPNIVQVLDFGRVGDSYFLAMEFVDGITLRALTRRLRAARVSVPLGVVAHIGREILAGLQYSHAGARDGDGALLKVVHRDLCPANVLLSRHGSVKITDFGVARALRDAAHASTATVAGHAAYMPPEQARGEPIGVRCDLYALGVILWELLVGRSLFHRDNAEATLLAVLSDPVPPPSVSRFDVDGAWDAFIERATRRDPERRFATADEMSAALGALPGVGGPCPDALAELIAHRSDVTDAGASTPSEAEDPTVQESFR